MFQIISFVYSLLLTHIPRPFFIGSFSTLFIIINPSIQFHRPPQRDYAPPQRDHTPPLPSAPGIAMDTPAIAEDDATTTASTADAFTMTTSVVCYVTGRRNRRLNRSPCNHRGRRRRNNLHR